MQLSLPRLPPAPPARACIFDGLPQPKIAGLGLKISFTCSWRFFFFAAQDPDEEVVSVFCDLGVIWHELPGLEGQRAPWLCSPRVALARKQAVFSLQSSSVGYRYHK